MAIDTEKAIRGINVNNLQIFREDDLMGKYIYNESFRIDDVQGRISGAIVSGAFYGKNITYANIPNVSYLQSRVFENCFSLSQVDAINLSDTGPYAFAYCVNLTRINVPKLTNVGNYAFYSCINLLSINLPEAQTIGSYAFNNCVNLSYADLYSCEFIRNGFVGCVRLNTLILRRSSVVSIASNGLNKTPMENSAYLGYYGSIYVPASLVGRYKGASAWSVYSDRITSIEGGGFNV